MQTAEIRRRWLKFFADRGHEIVPSASLISPDPSTMFTIAGMVPFIPYMLGEQPAPWPRATSVQKCVRTADIDEVGKTTRHGTFFQMNGNFSFGNYFKEDAIRYAWELITTPQDDGGYGFDPEKIWVTVFHEDDEAFDLWRKIADLPEERIQRRGREDNYWHTHQPGPAGPCSEIYVDRGPEYGKDGGPIVDEDRFIEIWNLVFMEYEITNVKSQSEFDIVGPLKQRNIDTGMGLERVAYLLQGVDNMYEIDELMGVIHRAEELAGRKYGANPDDDVRFRVVADHVRSALMLIGDGVTPSNEGRGYVLRRLMRRAVRAMRLLGVQKPVFPELFPASLELLEQSYPELREDYARISRIAYAEEESFLRTLTAGTQLLNHAVEKAKEVGRKLLSGAEAFSLHDTYGFPIDLTLEMAHEQGLNVDEQAFRDLMREQRERARADAVAKKGGRPDAPGYQELLAQGPTDFRAYQELKSEAKILGVLKDGELISGASQGDRVDVVLDRTPFYAESGGQEADAGVITGEGFELTVKDVQRVAKSLIVHTVEVTKGEVSAGQDVLAQVDAEWRTGARQAHSGTHVVHAALREVLGPGALQSGSYNKPGYLRLDFAWNEPLSSETRSEIEEITNLAIRKDLPVSAEYMSLPEAKEQGAIALFGETYDDSAVRVVEIGGPWSRELCGGTHVEHSSQIGLVTLTGEASVGAGSRRLEALVGMDALHQMAAERALVHAITEQLKVRPEEVPQRLEQLMTRLRDAERELEKQRKAKLLAEAGRLARESLDVAGIKVVTYHAGTVASADDVRALAVDVRQRMSDVAALVAIAGVVNEKPVVVVGTTEAARSSGKLQAGAFVRLAAQRMGGGGGGKPDLAQGGGTDPNAIDDALSAIATEVARTVGGK